MANAIGEINVKVLADISNMVSDLGKANAETAKFAKEAKENIESIKGAFEGVAAAIGVGFGVKELVELGFKAIDTAEQIDRMAQSLGASTQTLQTMQYVSATTGGSLDDATGAFVKLEKAAEGAAAGGKQQVEAFRAIGISAGQVGELLKNPDQLIQQVTTHLAGMENGSGKTTVMMELMGRSAAQNAKFINELGSDFAGATEEARKFGVVLSTEDNAALLKANDALDELGASMLGLGNQIGVGLAPAIEQITALFVDLVGSGFIQNFFRDTGQAIAETIVLIEHFVGSIRDLIGSFGEMKMPTVFVDILDGLQNDMDAFVRMKTQALLTWLEIQQGGEVAWTALQNSAIGALNDITVNLAHVLVEMADFAKNTGSLSLAETFSSAAISVADFSNSLKPVTANLDGYNAKYDKIIESMNVGLMQNSEWIDGLKAQANGTTEAGSAADKAAKQTVNYNAAVKDIKASVDKSVESLLKLQSVVDGINSKFGSPYQKAISEYNKGMTDLATAANKAAIEGADVTQVMKLWQQGQSGLLATLVQTTDKLKEQADIVGQLGQKYDEETRLLATTGIAHEQMKAIIDAENEARKQYEDHLRASPELSAAEVTAIESISGAHAQLTEKIKADQEASKAWQDLWTHAAESVGDVFAKFVVQGGSLMDGLKDVAKQVVQQIIAEFIKLKVIQPLLSGIFGGGGGGGWGSLIGAVAGGSGGGGGGWDISSIASFAGGGGGTNFASTGAGGTQFSIMSPTTWISAGKNLWNGFQNGFSASGSASSNMFGSYTPDYGTGTYTPSTLGYATAIAGGVYAGYNRFEGSNKDLGGAAGGVAYGVGTAYAAIGASAALSGGIAAGMAAIPVVGWIALAAMVLDMASGGKLFGTKGKMTGGWAEMGVSEAGGTAQNFIDMKGQKAFFGGATFTQDHVAASPEQQAAANAFFDAIKKGSDEFGKQFGLAAGEVASGIFSQKFDKKGNPTGETITHINGLDYKNETQAQFGARIQAESFTMDLAKIGLDITGYTHQFIQDADAYSKAVQESAGVAQAAQADIKNGVNFLALGTDQSITAIFKLAEANIGYGESIGQAFQRIEQAQQQYDQLVGKFKPAAVYVDDFEAAVSNINTTMQATIKQANALAIAAGAEGAATSDLTNIHNAAAKQFALLVTQLEASAQSLAFSMGLTTTGSLDQVSAEIQRLQGKAGQGATAVGSFGNAMQEASRSASDAIQLLLGDLSPLNDRQKLQTALQGLREGSVSQQDVLQIGRRLYASSQAYSDLFKQVQGIGVVAGIPGIGSGGGGGGGGSGGGLTSEERTRLADLLKEQQQLQAQQDLDHARALTQQIAEIAAAKDEDFHKVLTDMGIKESDLLERLGLSSDDQLVKMIGAIQAQKDTNGDNTSILADLLQKIVVLLGGSGLDANGHPIADRNRNGPPTGTIRPPTGDDRTIGQILVPRGQRNPIRVGATA